MAKDIKPAPHVPVTIETLEHTLAVLAYIVVKHGPYYAPLFERVERELEAARNGPEARARRVRRRAGGGSASCLGRKHPLAPFAAPR